MPGRFRAIQWTLTAVLTLCGPAPAQHAVHAAAHTVEPGSVWTLHFADGGKEKYRWQGAGEPGVSLFADRAGHEVKILVAEDSRVLIVAKDGGCYRTGRLVDGRVANGTSGGDCKPGGMWTADVR